MLKQLFTILRRGALQDARVPFCQGHESCFAAWAGATLTFARSTDLHRSISAATELP
jgi:hypothetical protein